jgi:hypothetical protein
MDLKPPKPMKFDGNLADNWKKWCRNFQNYSDAVELEKKPEKKQCAVLLHTIGEEAMEVYDTFNLAEGEKQTISSIMQKFADHFIPLKNITYERHKFFTRSQQPGETFDMFLTAIKGLSKVCDFGSLADEMLKDKIVIGIQNDNLRETLLQDAKLTLERAVNKCQASERSKHQLKEMGSLEINYVPKQGEQ